VSLFSGQRSKVPLMTVSLWFPYEYVTVVPLFSGDCVTVLASSLVTVSCPPPCLCLTLSLLSLYLPACPDHFHLRWLTVVLYSCTPSTRNTGEAEYVSQALLSLEPALLNCGYQSLLQHPAEFFMLHSASRTFLSIPS